MKKQDMIDDIIAVMKYRSGEGLINTVYVGGMTTASAVRALGGRYGKDYVEDLVKKADVTQLREAYRVLSSTIKYMKEHPTTRCKCCGQIIPAK